MWLSHSELTKRIANAIRDGLIIPCTRYDPELWFGDERRVEYEAKSLCHACPVQEPCLKHAMENDEYGVWGGLNRLERRILRNRKARGWQ